MQKRLLDKYAKKDRDLIIDAMKKGLIFFLMISSLSFSFLIGVQQLAKIKHPRVLSLQHSLEESRFVIIEHCRTSLNHCFCLLIKRDSLAFATESCLGSLANCLGFYDNINQPISKEFDDYKLYDVEIRYGIIQVSLQFLIILRSDQKFCNLKGKI